MSWHLTGGVGGGGGGGGGVGGGGGGGGGGVKLSDQYCLSQSHAADSGTYL